MASPTSDDPWPLPELTRARRAIVVVDVVESVRLMQEDEAGFIDRWRRFVHQVRNEVLPRHGGRMVKSLGDGMLLEFEAAPSAMASVMSVRDLAGATTPVLALRIGLHVCEVAIDEIDVFGTGVNLASRLATLAQPGQIVVSADARDGLLTGVDPDLEDMGECYVKHVAAPVRAWRVAAAAPSDQEPIGSGNPDAELLTSIAVLPFEGGPEGAVIADDVCESLMKGRTWRVVSRLSAAGAAARGLTAFEVGKLLHTRWVVHGTLRSHGARVVSSVTLIDTRLDQIAAIERFDEPASDFQEGSSQLGARIAQWVALEVANEEARLSAQRPLPSVASHALLLAATHWIHRMAREDNRRANEALEHLAERHPRCPEPRIWIAKAQLVTLAQGWAADPKVLSRHARDQLARALDMRPDHALALALEGHLGAYANGELDAADRLLRHAVEVNQHEPLAWLFLSNLRANRGHGAAAVEAADRARSHSPLDPMAFMFDIYAAYAALIAGDHARAVELARRSVRANCQHFPSHPVLICAEAAAGEVEAARASARRYLTLRPQSSITSFAAAHRGTSQIVSMLCSHLREAGMPA
jgi:class 3 adenylate cyclase/tetratricopeptide (TPR) repeat protein